MSGLNEDAEGANLEQANPDETLRQKDPALAFTLERSFRQQSNCWRTTPTV